MAANTEKLYALEWTDRSGWPRREEFTEAEIHDDITMGMLTGHGIPFQRFTRAWDGSWRRVTYFNTSKGRY